MNINIKTGQSDAYRQNAFHNNKATEQEQDIWLKQISQDNNSTNYIKRAEYYMKAMPAWAEK